MNTEKSPIENSFEYKKHESLEVRMPFIPSKDHHERIMKSIIFQKNNISPQLKSIISPFYKIVSTPIPDEVNKETMHYWWWYIADYIRETQHVILSLVTEIHEVNCDIDDVHDKVIKNNNAAIYANNNINKFIDGKFVQYDKINEYFVKSAENLNAAMDTMKRTVEILDMHRIKLKKENIELKEEIRFWLIIVFAFHYFIIGFYILWVM